MAQRTVGDDKHHFGRWMEGWAVVALGFSGERKQESEEGEKVAHVLAHVLVLELRQIGVALFFSLVGVCCVQTGVGELGAGAAAPPWHWCFVVFQFSRKLNIKIEKNPILQTWQTPFLVELRYYMYA